MQRSSSSHWIPIFQALFVTFLWSTSWVLIKLGLQEIPAIGFAGLRYALAFLVLAPALLARADLRAALRALTRTDWLRLGALGIVFYTLTQGAQFVALAFLPAVTLGLVFSFSPAAVALLGASVLGERLTRPQWGGLALFLVGALVYFLPVSAALSAAGLVAALLGLLANSCGALLGRSVNRQGRLHPLLVTVVSMGVGSLLLLITALIVEGVPRLDSSGWGIVLWLAVVNTAFAFTLWNHTLRRLTAVQSSLINNTMLAQVAVLAWLFLGEPIGLREGCGLLLALAGVLLVQLKAGGSAMEHRGPRLGGTVSGSTRESLAADEERTEETMRIAGRDESERLGVARRLSTFLITVPLIGLSAGCASLPVTKPIPVRVVVVTMFEIGEDEGDRAGEFQLWKERQSLSKRFEVPGADHDVFMNPETGVLGMVTGVGTARAAASTMAVGLDPRFDFRRAYWLIAGIAGFDPQDASVGSAAWAEYLVDGDLAHQIDAREIPDDWLTGYFPRRAKMPSDPVKPEPRGEMYRLNPELTEWAYQLTKDVDLGDDEALAEHRALYTEHENGQRPPFVLKGDHLAASTFWHGSLLNEWANSWVDYWTDGEGEFVSSAMEDTGTYQALSWLHDSGRVDRNRVMLLRTASNYTMPPPGVGAAENLVGEKKKGYSGLDVSIESAYRVGARVVDEITSNWDRFRGTIPTP